MGYLVYSNMGSGSSTSPPVDGTDIDQIITSNAKVFKDEGKESLRTLYKTDAAKRASIISDV